MRHTPPRGPQAGFSLVELLIAIMLALFLLGGLFAIIQSNKRAYTSQTNLSQQEDNERFAMTVLAEVIQAAGYFTDPTTQQPATVFTVQAPFATAGQSVYGISGVGATGDSVTVQYWAKTSDAMINCDGSQSVSAAGQLWVNTFSVNAQNQLICQLNANNPVALVDNVKSMTVLYGVRTNPASGTVDSYLTAAQITAANWPNVVSVRVTVNFINALTSTTGQPATVPVSRTIAIMAKNGFGS